ncbi:hypothetical protein ACSN7R_002423, partial [Flavobacterium psychrophilum]
FRAIANFVVNSRLRFARNIILVENNRLRSSQLTRSGGTMEKIALRDNFFHRAPATQVMKNHRCFRTMFFHHPLC